MENIVFYEITPSDIFLNDLEKHKKSGQKKLLTKIVVLLKELRENPTTGTGQIEQLKGFGERSIWSRRIDKKHRLIYEIFDENKSIELLSCYGHYNDK